MTSHPTSADGPSGLGDELDRVLGEAAARQLLPGAAVGLVVGDEVHVATHGTTNAEHPLPVTTDTLFQVGSISKTLTSAAVMLLVEQDRLDLVDPVARHLPGASAVLGAAAETTTVEHLLSHRSGLDGDHLFVTGETEDLTALADARRLFPPGEGFSYSNAGFSVAGAVIEAASGRSYEELVTAELLRPLGLATATFRADEAITHRVAAPHWVADGRGHVLRGAGWQPGWELGRLDRPAGGLIASVAHLLAWCRFQWTGTALDGSTLLSAESLHRLHTAVVEADRTDAIALDWFVRRTDGVTTIGHGGTTVGYVSDLVVAPERQVAVVTLTNATDGGAVAQVVRRWALERLVGAVERDPEPASSAVAAGRYLGRYRHAFAVFAVTAGPAPGTLVITPERRDDVGDGWQPPVGRPVTYALVGDDHAVSVDGAGPATVVRFAPPDGAAPGAPAAWLLSGYRRAPRIEDVPSPT